jgi:hypothetical protein
MVIANTSPENWQGTELKVITLLKRECLTVFNRMIYPEKGFHFQFSLKP